MSDAYVGDNQFPSFIFIGPDKTGSTWIYRILQQHPQCYVPDIKDIYFFDRYFDRGIDWYVDHFREAREHSAFIAAGELSHDYLFSEAAAERIHQELPQVKLITCLRDPVDRTFSHYLYLHRSGLVKTPLLKAVDEFPELITNSRYSHHLPAYFQRFHTSQILVLNFADLVDDSRLFARLLFDFLDLDYLDDLEYDEQVLSASRPRNYMLARIVKHGASLAREMGLSHLVGRLKSGILPRLLYQAYSPDDKPRLSEAERSHLERLLGDERQSLEQLLHDYNVNFQFR